MFTKKEVFDKFTVPTVLKWILIVIIILYVLGIIINRILFQWEFWDDDTHRGAMAIYNDPIDTNSSIPLYLNQGWDKSESLWFYNTTQGSNLIPYDFFMVLEQKNSPTLFRDNAHMNAYRYLIQKPTFSNEDGLPLGFAKDVYQNKEYLGFTCAACHTTQINYKGKALRIDGAPTMADMDTFMVDLEVALSDTLYNAPKRDRFVANVLQRNKNKSLFSSKSYTNSDEILIDLFKFQTQIENYNAINHGEEKNAIAYGYARLDAFGRIYNRVAQHAINKKVLTSVLLSTIGELRTKEIWTKLANHGVPDSHIVTNVSSYLREGERKKIFDKLFTKANAPVSYPFLWDIVQHDYIQWNGIVDNSNLGPIGRNIGQVIGVFGTLDWEEKEGFSLSSLIGSQSLSSKYTSYASSIDVRNLYRVEKQLKHLSSPQWPEHIFGNINKTAAKEGEKLYDAYCLSCHTKRDRKDTDKRLIAKMSSIHKVRTDPTMAQNSVHKLGYTGVVEGMYLDSPVGKVFLEEKAPVAEILTMATRNVVATPDMDKTFIIRWSDWIYDLFFTLIENDVKQTIKRGDYTPDTTANPYASLLSYKARPLNGIWATAPYLHNGSVPTLYDLLLPQEERPAHFQVGSREFDPEKVGYRTSGYTGFTFDTSLQGNLNTGHEYAAGKTSLANGETLPKLNKKQRLELLEYLKTL